ncbi:histidine kinase [Micrococcus luteus]|uniref:sensor histidine kinase n=1 Tax=Micrococcus TaxID=1269 RepID=UPI00119A3496|nr:MULTISPECIES: histidine kinase [Micrococcus]MBU8649847.1 histidine kinase [Micrococcus luteus]MCV7509945.1 histidine kinase [Micrococcus luteus]MCV7604788.1 histidine kinase [Micrococcus luteus]MCV7612947.1 histidine kinase [Micrococcus luteus]MDK7176746.1 histidine kinase [Micrococcus luteus]
MTSEHTSETRRLRSRTSFVLLAVFGVAAIVTLLTSAVEPWPPLVLAPGLIAGLWLLSQWHRQVAAPTRWAVLALGTLTWALSALWELTPLGALAFALAGALEVMWSRRTRAVMTLLTLTVGAAVGVLVVVTDPQALWVYVGMGALLTGAACVTIPDSRASFDLMRLQDQRAEQERATSVDAERLRFSQDLHDIQGHALHVVKLKIAVAQRLLSTDTEAARRELDEAQQTLRQTMAETKALAQDGHTLTLRGELANSVSLLEAAGITVTTDDDGGPRTEKFEHVAGVVIREGTTNILRHSDARRVDISLAPGHVVMSNDGVLAVPAEDHRGGLENLRSRLAGVGGRLDVSCGDGRFTLGARWEADEEESV